MKAADEILEKIATLRGATCHELAEHIQDRRHVGRVLGTMKELGLVTHLNSKRDGQVVNRLTSLGWDLVEHIRLNREGE